MMRSNRTLIILILTVFSFGLFSFAFADRSDEYYRKVQENLELFRDIYREIATKYVDDIDPQEFIRAGIRGMLETLDPYTVFIDKEDIEDLAIMTSGKYGGVGIVIGLKGEEKALTVISPMEGTPADKVGIRAGDQILEIDCMSTVGFDTRKAASLLRGEAGTKVTLKILRIGNPEPIIYTLTREIITVKDVSYAGIIKDGIGYIRLTRFSGKAGEEMDSTLKMLKAQNLKGLILDLRGNPGGLLETAVQIGEEFIPKGETIVSTHGMIPEADRTIKSKETPLCGDLPLVVLVDEGSASASEIVAGAVQDLDRGVIIGNSTFGKGLVQSLVNFKNGTELKITTAKYYTPSGRLIQKVDYFGEDNPVILQKVKTGEIDSSRTKYFTAHGREVFGGGGITPDIIVDDPAISNISAALFRESMFFNFANDYLTKATPEIAISDPNLINEFQRYLEENKFQYKTDGQSEIETLGQIAQEKALTKEFNECLARIDTILESTKTRDFDQNRSEIERYLKMEFASRRSGEKGRFEESISGDLQLLKALEVIKDCKYYAQILSEKVTVKNE